MSYISPSLSLRILETLTWYQPETYGSSPSPRSSHSAVAWNSKLVVFGGSGRNYSNELFVFDTQTMTWSKEETTGPIPSERWCHTAVVFGDNIFAALFDMLSASLVFVDST